MIRLSSYLAPCVISAAVFTAILPNPASASFTQYSSRAAFDAVSSFVPVDWSVFGPPGTQISTPAFATANGVQIGITSSQGALARHEEGLDFIGDFSPGDQLLTDAGSESDSFIVFFPSPVRGFGTQIDPHYILGPFSGDVAVYDASNTLLFTASFSGVATKAEDNSAPFVGVVSSLPDIASVSFLINQTSPGLPPQSGAVAINRLDVLHPVPEPAALLLFLSGLAGIGLLCRRKSL